MEMAQPETQKSEQTSTLASLKSRLGSARKFAENARDEFFGEDKNIAQNKNTESTLEKIAHKAGNAAHKVEEAAHKIADKIEEKIPEHVKNALNLGDIFGSIRDVQIADTNSDANKISLTKDLQNNNPEKIAKDLTAKKQQEGMGSIA